MPTDKDAAAAMRVIAAWHIANNRPHLANMEDDRADELDPPTPTYPDGLYCWEYGPDYPSVTYVRRSGGHWLDAFGQPDDQLDPPNKCTRVRVLGDDEIAVKRIEVAHRGPTSTAEFMRESVRRVNLMNHGSHVTAAVKAVLAAYADALDAEAGGAK